jgi:hypothetical protein
MKSMLEVLGGRMEHIQLPTALITKYFGSPINALPLKKACPLGCRFRVAADLVSSTLSRDQLILWMVCASVLII